MKKIVIKIGSSSLVKNSAIDINHLSQLALVSKQLVLQGYAPIIVTSGAIAMGMGSLDLKIKPKKMALKQACAAIGQALLMHEYQEAFTKEGLKVAQILLNHDDFSVRDRILHLHQTLEELIMIGIVPIINENDALAVEEIKVGDNDTLSSLVAALEEATHLILISDIDGLYNQNPSLYPNATRIREVYAIDEALMDLGKDAISNVGTGGMKTKLQAAKIATASGVAMGILHVRDLDKLKDLNTIPFYGTLFYPQKRFSAKRHWLLYSTSPKGTIILDHGASLALQEHKSVLPKGVLDVEGQFLGGSVINIKDDNHLLLGRGVTPYSSNEIAQIKRLSLEEAQSRLGLPKTKPIVHADDVVLGDA